jgi:hypothetical protein
MLKTALETTDSCNLPSKAPLDNNLRSSVAAERLRISTGTSVALEICVWGGALLLDPEWLLAALCPGSVGSKKEEGLGG